MNKGQQNFLVIIWVVYTKSWFRCGWSRHIFCLSWFFSNMLQVWRHSVRKCVTNLFEIHACLIICMKLDKVIWLLFELCWWKAYFNAGKVDIFSVSHWFFQNKLKLWDFFLRKFAFWSLLTTHYPHFMHKGKWVYIIFVCVYLRNIVPKISVKLIIFSFSLIFQKNTCNA